MSSKLLSLYYFVKPIIPRRMQIWVRRISVKCRLHFHRHHWPINEPCGKTPAEWQGWPENKRFALVLTHDVETNIGQFRCERLAKLEIDRGFRSAFNFVPERYQVSSHLQEHLQEQGFEIGVHGLLHDGRLFSSRKCFMQRAKRINHYLKAWGSIGFRSPSMLHNLDWMHALDIGYDMSTFDFDPFEPQSDAIGSIFPFRTRDSSDKESYVEIPYTLPQDSTLFLMLEEKGIETWKRKLDWIVARGGMAVINVHPDYMQFEGEDPDDLRYPAAYYERFLDYIRQKYEGMYWHALPSEVMDFTVNGKDWMWRAIS